MRILSLPSRRRRKCFFALLGVTLLLGCEDLQWLLDDPSAPPDPPVLSAVESPTRLRRVGIGGNKPAGTGVVVGDTVVVPLDSEVLFGFLLELTEGEHTYDVRTFDAGDRRSEPVTLTVDLDVVPPGAPTVDPPPAFTLEDSVTLTGTREPGTAVWMNGVEIVPVGDATAFTLTGLLVFGENDFRIAAQDAVGNESDVVVVTVTRVEDLDMTPPPPPELDPLPGLATSAVVSLTGTLLEAGDVVIDGLVVLEDAPAGPFTAAATVMSGVVTLDVRARDQAGNLSEPVSPAPTVYVNPAGLVFAVDPLPAVTFTSPVTVTGIRGSDVDVYLDGALASPAGGGTTFSIDVPLSSGTNELLIEGRAGPASTSVIVSISLEEMAPGPPVLDETDIVTSTAAISVTGQRAPGTAVLRGMVEVVPPGPDPAFTDDIIVDEGVTVLRYAARDSYGRVSAEVAVTVTYVPPPVDAGPGDAGDAGPVDGGPIDAGPGDAGLGDAGPNDAGPGDGG